MQQPAKRKKPLGHPIIWTDNDLDQLSQVHAPDIQAARALWRNEAPMKFKTLLQAQPTERGS